MANICMNKGCTNEAMGRKAGGDYGGICRECYEKGQARIAALRQDRRIPESYDRELSRRRADREDEWREIEARKD